MRSSRRIAVGISYILNPLILPPALFGFILVNAGAPISETARVTTVLTILLAVLPLAYLRWMVRTGRSSSIEVLDRRQRVGPYVVGLVCATAALLFVVNWADTAAPIILSLSLCLVLNAALLMSINHRWKISIHAATVAGFLAVLITVTLVTTQTFPLYAAWFAPAVPLVMWARVRSGAHTSAETWAGAAFGLLIPTAEMGLLHLIGMW